jgi:hypothetical protein
MVFARLKSKIRSQIKRTGNGEIITSPHWLSGNVEAIRRASGLPPWANDRASD